MSKRKGGWGLGAVAGVGALLALGGMAFAKQSGSGSSDWPGGGSGGGGGGSGGGGGGGTDPWTPGPGGNGKVYGSGSDPNPGWLPTDFDFDGNGLWISPDCTGVIEGSKFRPNPTEDWISAIEPTEWSDYQPGNDQEVEAVQQVDPGNSIAGFVDWAMNHDLPKAPEPFTAWVSAHLKDALRPKASSTAIRLAAEILRQVSPVCMEIPNFAELWGDGLKFWLEDFLLWLDLYLHEWWQDSIEFDPEST